MIIITHHNDRVVKIENETASVAAETGNSLLSTILGLAKEYPDAVLVWVAKEYREVLNLDYFRKNKNFENTLQSFNPSGNYMSNDIGYVEETLFVNVNKEVKYATWLMSATVGCSQSFVFNAIESTLATNTPFDYYLNAIAKQAMPQGLLCYSNPHFLKSAGNVSTSVKGLSTKQFFEFIKQHYKKRWLFLASVQLLIFEGRFTFFYALLASFKPKHSLSYTVSTLKLSKTTDSQKIDVVIPTMGRKEYLLAVLKDLKAQTLQPKCIIIVEQNAEQGSESQLDYLQKENWPFEIKHTFIHQTGACNARNLALEQVTGDWVFFADDDIRLEKNALAHALSIAHQYGMDAVTMSCLQKGEKEQVRQPMQWIGFGAGTSLVKTTAIGDKKFDMGYEFGHGEDGDFGMQLRNRGTDVLYIPSVQLLHLKAPIGGFRQKHIQPWDGGDIAPKPSPTVMLYKIRHLTKEQLNSYKFTLFTKYYKRQSTKNPFAYLKKMNKAWKESIHWANQLNENNGN